MKGFLFVPIGVVCLAGYVYAGTLFAQSAKRNSEEVHGNGKVITQNRTVDPYTKVVIGSAFEGQFFESTPGPLTISAESNLLPMIETKVSDGVLYVTTKGSIRTKKGFKITGRASHLDALDASGAAKINLKGIKSHRLHLNASGAAQLDVFGTPTDLVANASGASKITFSRLNLDSLVAELSGASKMRLDGRAKQVKVSASGASQFGGKLSGLTLGAEASGASNIDISGHFDSKKTRTSGVSKISRID